MKGLVHIKGVGKKENVLVLLWRTKGQKKTGYKITNFEMYMDNIARITLPEVTRNKLDLYMSELRVLWKLKKIRTELDLEIFTNHFAKVNGVGFLFNGKRHFKIEHTGDNEPVHIDINHLVPINENYYKERYDFIKKQMIKAKQGE